MYGVLSSLKPERLAWARSLPQVREHLPAAHSASLEKGYGLGCRFAVSFSHPADVLKAGVLRMF